MKIKSLEIKNFKNFRDIKLELSNLTVLTGINSTGKSSIIHSLLLLRESYLKNDIKTRGSNQKKAIKLDLAMKFQEERMEELTNLIEIFSKIDLKDQEKLDIFFKEKEEIVEKYQKLSIDKLVELDYKNKIDIEGIGELKINKLLNLGICQDILFDDAEDEIMKLRIKNNDSLFEIISDLSETGEENFFYAKFKLKEEEKFNLFNNNFQYLSASRIIPNDEYKRSDQNILLNNVGIEGEYTVHYLYEHGKRSLAIKELQHPMSETDSLRNNVNKWLEEISNNISVETGMNIDGLSFSLSYKYTNEKKRSPYNIGFGLTYALPIIVSILKAKKGDLIIIENPESHLHPSAQSTLARLCSKAANAGIQIMIETHSEHFINGIRVAVKEKDVRPEEISIYYFLKNVSESSSNYETLQINEYGQINNWPSGFCDEWEIQLEKLLC